MQHPFKHRIHRELITGLLLVALAFRALIPVGFMPTGEHGFSLEICRAGTLAPASAIDQHTPSQRSAHFEHCLFAASAAGPISNLPVLQPLALTAVPSLGEGAASRRASAFERAHQPRAPPRLA
jgi:hypothetical protein